MLMVFILVLMFPVKLFNVTSNIFIACSTLAIAVYARCMPAKSEVMAMQHKGIIMQITLQTNICTFNT